MVGITNIEQLRVLNLGKLTPTDWHRNGSACECAGRIRSHGGAAQLVVQPVDEDAAFALALLIVAVIASGSAKVSASAKRREKS